MPRFSDRSLPTFRRVKSALTSGRAVQMRREAFVIWILSLAAERGLSTRDALAACRSDLDDTGRSQVDRVVDRLDEGVPLTEAFDPEPRLLSTETLLSIRVGEEAGILPRLLKLESRRLTNQIIEDDCEHRGLIFYSVVIGTLVMGMLSFLSINIAPKYALIFESFEVDLPSMTRQMLEVSEGIMQNVFIVIPLLVAAGWVLVQYAGAIDQRFRGEPRYPQVVRTLPIYSRLRRRQSTGAVLQRLGSLVSAGKPLRGGLTIMAGYHPDAGFRNRLKKVVAVLDGGQDPWMGFQQSGLLTLREVQLLRASEEVGNLPWMLDSVADRIRRGIDQTCRLIFEFLRPVILLALAVTVGFFVTSYFLPLIKVINDLS